jgi:alpha-glucosidase (family GH31 glycosyl hydrolase)
MDQMRRNLLAGLGVGSAHLLFSRTLSAASLFVAGDAATAAPGLLDLQLVAVSDNTLRISISPANDPPRFWELAVGERKLPAPLATPGHVHAQTVPWGKYTVRISDMPLHITVLEGGRSRQEIRFDLDSTDVRFDLNGPTFGLGEGVHPFDRRGTADNMANGQHSPDLETFGARVPIPWVFGPGGPWGVFVGQPQGSFVFSQTEARFRSAEATSTRNVFLLLGDTPASVLHEYAHLTGFPQLPPLWSFGFQQSHRTITSEQEILSVAETFRSKKLPCDALIYLGTGFCPSGWNIDHGSFTFNKKVFPNPPDTIRKFHDQHFKVIVHIVPPGDFHGHVTDTGTEAEEPGDAVPYWKKHLPVAAAGVDGWWPDEGDHLSVYSRLERNEMYWEGGRKYFPGKRPFALHRNGYAGLQRFGWLWSGDTFSTWKALTAQIMVGINVGLSGIPFWGTDTGGFVPTIEYTPELYIRWFQFSAFCPSFRCHGRAWKLHLPWGWNLGSAEPKEIEGSWVAKWPPESDLHRTDVEEICRTFLNLRYELLPYLYATAAQAHQTGLPIIRALGLMYPGEDRLALVDNAYLWGDHILVAPIHEKGALQRSVPLPKGTWWDFWSSAKVEGGQDTLVEADLRSMPLFVRAGAILPLGPVKQYTDEPDTEPTTLRVYPGANGHFSWYDDDGDGFDYENGSYMRLDCKWVDSTHTLNLTRSGKLGHGRKLRIEVVGTKSSRETILGDGPTTIHL